MENKSIKKILAGAIFVLGVILTSASYSDVLAQNNTKTNTNTSSTAANNTETLQDFEQIEGSDSLILSNDTNISNPNNNIDDSLSVNENQSY